ILRVPGDLSDSVQRTPALAISSAMVGVPGCDTALIALSAGPGLGLPVTQLPASRSASRARMPAAISPDGMRSPSFAPFAPYHSWIATSVPRGGAHRVPSGNAASVPSASAHHSTENGLLLPQSK